MKLWILALVLCMIATFLLMSVAREISVRPIAVIAGFSMIGAIGLLPWQKGMAGPRFWRSLAMSLASFNGAIIVGYLFRIMPWCAV